MTVTAAAPPPDPPTTPLLSAALAFHDNGCCVIPARTDGTKAPAVNWRAYMTQRPDRDQVAAWASGPYDGIGLVCGAVSGNLGMLEAEGRAVTDGYLPRLAQAMADHGMAELWNRVATGYMELTPSGGMHWLYRVSDGPEHGNTKLARRVVDGQVQVLFETRGEGGFTVVSPSAGRTHPTGHAWQLIAGGPDTIPTVTTDERDMLHAVIRLLDDMPAIEPEPWTATEATGERPGDLFNQQASWDDLLPRHGWTKVRRLGRGWAWRRPGKDHGISATTGQRDDADRLYVFTTSTAFDAERPYSKFAALTLLEHGGDYRAAARALAPLTDQPRRSDTDALAALVAPTPAPPPQQQPSEAQTATQPVEADSDGVDLDEIERLAYARELAAEIRRLRLLQDARQALRREAQHDPTPLDGDAGHLDELLARPEVAWRCDGLLPAEGRMLLTAQRKTGKTTMTGNLARCLTRGEPFLNRFDVRQVDGQVVVLNFEVSGRQIARWYDEIGVPHRSCYVVNLRGRRNPFADDAGLAELAELIRRHDGEVLMVDPFGRAYTGSSQNDAAEVGPWLSTLDRLAAQAGIKEVVLVAHAGWDGERTRGSSALEDWPDTIATLTRDDEDRRFFRAEGRDVDVDEDALTFDPISRRLTLAGVGSRKTAKADRAVEGLVPALVDVVHADPGIGLNQIGVALREKGVDYRRENLVKASHRAENRALVRIAEGARNARIHYPLL